jgi:CheY-like chemotaxis protein
MGKRIMLCDDEIYILRAAEFKLQEAGYEVEITVDGEEAWEAILKHKPDLLISDYCMPKLNGFDLIRRIRDNPQTADIPVFLLTSKLYTIAGQVIPEDLNIIHVISKPFSPRELLKLANNVLKNVTEEV